MFYFQSDEPVSQSVIEPVGASPIVTDCHPKTVSPSNHKRRKYDQEVAQRDGTYFPEMGISREEMDEAPADDFCSSTVAFITAGKLPEDEKVAKQIILRESHYVVVQDILYYIQVGSGMNVDLTALIVIPLSLQQFVLRAHHDVPMAGHFGSNKCQTR